MANSATFVSANKLLMFTEKQFEDLFRSHFADMCNMAYSIVKDRDQAHDVAQQVFVHLWDKRDELEVQGNIRAYLQRSVINSSLNFIEKHRRIQYEDEYTKQQQDSAIQQDTSDFLQGEMENIVKNAIENLPEKCQLVFSLSRFQEMSNQEIADHLEISVKAVEKHITRALSELRVTLKPYLHLIGIFSAFGVGLNLFKLFL